MSFLLNSRVESGINLTFVERDLFCKARSASGKFENAAQGLNHYRELINSSNWKRLGVVYLQAWLFEDGAMKRLHFFSFFSVLLCPQVIASVRQLCCIRAGGSTAVSHFQPKWKPQRKQQLVFPNSFMQVPKNIVGPQWGGIPHCGPAIMCNLC